MRDERLQPLFRPVSALSGVGPKAEGLLTKLVLPAGANPPATLIDLLLHLPSAIVDRSARRTISDTHEGMIATIAVRIIDVRGLEGARHGRPIRITAEDDTGELQIVYFNARPDWLGAVAREGEKVVVSGKIELWNGQRQMVHPDYAVPLASAHTIPRFERIYPLTAGLSPKLVRKAMSAALGEMPSLPDWLDRAVPSLAGLPAFAEALSALHGQENAPAPDPSARRRLAYDEILSAQLALALIRHFSITGRGVARAIEGHRAQKVMDGLPFSLTGAQIRAHQEIRADLGSTNRMVRLIQGDVGAGKTLVALLAMADMAEAGAQSALMAPTEVLARQHFETLSRFAQPAGLQVAILTGREKGSVRTQTLAGLADGSIDIVVGTHALIQDGVGFKALGLAVIDEQHRFGVGQRLKLSDKGAAVDLLAMTATPIPRTLVMAWYGDLDVSKLDEKPAGRKPIDTRALPMERLDAVVDRLRAALEAGAKGYWICPLVEESDESDLTAAIERHEALQRAMGPTLAGKIALVHGRMKGEEKDAAMAGLKDGTSQLLVATTVVEVGVDVRDATIMVIEHAERFGLSQLHQLRGRIGRGDEASTCLLLYAAPLGATAQARLEAMRETNDGFVLAERDLDLRGAGDVLGTRQSGFKDFEVADAALDRDLIAVAHDDARLMVSQDPHLRSERGKALRLLLQLFRRDSAVRLMQSG
ncbi:MAG: ATP-dependent DNA helicase RecG [Devosiaceae bacterium]|nr:ATP-dependent DNA helicase RecG [Devosiaceae bacterium MH13]